MADETQTGHVVSLTDADLKPLYDGIDGLFAARARWSGYELATLFVVVVEKFAAKTGFDREQLWQMIEAGRRNITYTAPGEGQR